MRALRIPTDGRVELVDVDVTLEWLQHQVGGMIEVVHVDQILTDAGRRSVDADVYLNEDGKGLMLPLNHKATDLCALAIGGWYRDVIVGSVVVLGSPDDEGEDTAVPESVVRIARNFGWLRP
jgi:hypothetical protein